MPSHFAEHDVSLVSRLVLGTGFGHLVCSGEDGLASTPLPFSADDDLASIRAHLARANPIWRSAPCPAMLIVPLSDAYVSPGWYPSKIEHGKVVPTWNYEVVQLHGHLVIHDDSDWIHSQITELTNHNERSLPSPWAVTDAPAAFIAKQAHAIVGLELVVERIEAKRKLSQNRSAEDQAGVIAGLRAHAQVDTSVAGSMERTE